MTIKRLRLFGLMVFITAVIVTACKDEFSEEDFLSKQYDLANSKHKRDSAYLASLNKDQADTFIAALNEAGDLMAVTIVVREDGAPVSGVAISFIGGTPEAPASGGRTSAVTPVTTGADGTAVVERMPIGRHTISLSKSGYATAIALVDFGTPGNPQAITNTVNGVTQTTYVAPKKRFENISFPLFSTAAGGRIATVKGNVTQERDLTNLTPEIPQNLTLRADLSGLLNLGGSGQQPSGSVTIFSYVIDGGGLGVATVDNTTGAYTMTLPASTVGGGLSGLRILVPELEGNQRLAINGIDDGTGTAKKIATGPEFRDIPTKWGGNINTTSGTVTVFGAKVVFPTPPAAGKGFAFDFTAQPRSIPTGTISSTSNQNVGGVTYKITNRGAGYTSTPTVALSGSGSVVTAPVARLRAAVSQLTRTAAGSGYTFINVNLVKVDPFAAETILGDLAVTPVSGGLPATFDPASFINEFNFGVNSPRTNIADAASFKVTVTGDGTGATVSAVIDASLDRIVISDGGSGFNAAPTITVSGGGASTQGTIQVVDFPTQWNVTPNNAGNTIPYSVLPQNIFFSYPATVVSDGFTSDDVNYHTSGIGTLESSFNSILGSVAANSGQVVLKNPGITLRTSDFWSAKPAVIIVDDAPRKADVALYISNTNLGELDFNFFNDFGNGYNTPFQFTVAPAIAGEPGTGASFLLYHNYDATTGEYSLNGGVTRLNGGTGYVPNLNRKAAEADNISTNGISLPALQPGKEYIVDVKYGTGERKVIVN